MRFFGHFFLNMSEKFYAVAKGHKVGIFRTWAECSAHVTGFQGPVFRKFPTLEAAEDFIKWYK